MGKNLDATERARLDSSMRRVYAELQRAGNDGLLNWELVSKTGALDAPRRARELRARGFAIEVLREEGGSWRYRLLQSRPLALTLDLSRLTDADLDEAHQRGRERIDGLLQQPLFGDDGEDD